MARRFPYLCLSASQIALECSTGLRLGLTFSPHLAAAGFTTSLSECRWPHRLALLPNPPPHTPEASRAAWPFFPQRPRLLLPGCGYHSVIPPALCQGRRPSPRQRGGRPAGHSAWRAVPAPLAPGFPPTEASTPALLAALGVNRRASRIGALAVPVLLWIFSSDCSIWLGDDYPPQSLRRLLLVTAKPEKAGWPSPTPP
jgi:hypothetical protein